MRAESMVYGDCSKGTPAARFAGEATGKGRPDGGGERGDATSLPGVGSGMVRVVSAAEKRRESRTQYRQGAFLRVGGLNGASKG